ncbi:MAG: ATP-grasp domain-containing protein [Nibricoccus sp.]
MISPGKTIGVLGGGQLGRMFAQAAQTLGYRVHVYEPAGQLRRRAPPGQGGECVVRPTWRALQEFARGVDVVTYEFENIPSGPLDAIAPLVPLHPRSDVLHICQNRQREKSWLKAHGFPHVAYAEALDGDIASAVKEVGLPCVVKTADFGYDGEGQMKLTTAAELEKAIGIVPRPALRGGEIVEFTHELSVIVARSQCGEMRTFPVSENIHTNHILDFSIVPARIAEACGGRGGDDCEPTSRENSTWSD